MKHWTTNLLLKEGDVLFTSQAQPGHERHEVAIVQTSHCCQAAERKEWQLLVSHMHNVIGHSVPGPLVGAHPISPPFSVIACKTSDTS